MKVEVLSHFLFDEKMKELMLDDNNVEAFQKRFDKAVENLQKRFKDLEIETEEDTDGTPEDLST